MRELKKEYKASPFQCPPNCFEDITAPSFFRYLLEEILKRAEVLINRKLRVNR
jgi:hypothetical protein